MRLTILITILACVLVFGLVVLFVYLFCKKGDDKYDRMSAIASFITAIVTIVIGIATIHAFQNDEKRTILQNQPLYSVDITSSDLDGDLVLDNEEYRITNVGPKTKSKTNVTTYTFLEISYTVTNPPVKHETRLFQLRNYFGAGFVTYNLDGLIQYSLYSGRNYEQFYELFNASMKYGELHPGIIVLVQKRHFFALDYEDVFGESHRVVKTDGTEIDSEQLKKMIDETNDAGFVLEMFKLDIDSILKIGFHVDDNTIQSYQ